jgi:glutamate synthase domain-containing protein 2
MMLMSLDWATQRLINLLNAWREQMVEILVKLGISSTKELRGRSDVLYYAKEAV